MCELSLGLANSQILDRADCQPNNIACLICHWPPILYVSRSLSCVYVVIGEHLCCFCVCVCVVSALWFRLFRCFILKTAIFLTGCPSQTRHRYVLFESTFSKLNRQQHRTQKGIKTQEELFWCEFGDFMCRIRCCLSSCFFILSLSWFDCCCALCCGIGHYNSCYTPFDLAYSGIGVCVLKSVYFLLNLCVPFKNGPFDVAFCIEARELMIRELLIQMKSARKSRMAGSIKPIYLHVFLPNKSISC